MRGSHEDRILDRSRPCVHRDTFAVLVRIYLCYFAQISGGRLGSHYIRRRHDSSRRARHGDSRSYLLYLWRDDRASLSQSPGFSVRSPASQPVKRYDRIPQSSWLHPIRRSRQYLRERIHSLHHPHLRRRFRYLDRRPIRRSSSRLISRRILWIYRVLHSHWYPLMHSLSYRRSWSRVRWSRRDVFYRFFFRLRSHSLRLLSWQGRT